MLTTRVNSVIFRGLSNRYSRIKVITSGPGMGPYRPRVEQILQYSTQPIRDRPVGGGGHYFHTVHVSIYPGDTRVRSRAVGVVYVRRVDGL